MYKLNLLSPVITNYNTLRTATNDQRHKSRHVCSTDDGIFPLDLKATALDWNGAIIAALVCAVGIALYCGRDHRRDSDKEAAYIQLPEGDIETQSVFSDEGSGSGFPEEPVEMAALGGKRSETGDVVPREQSTSP